MTELRALTCVHCGAVFVATASQWKHRNVRQAVCSIACNLARWQTKRKPMGGPCSVCGEMFRSRGAKARLFCSMSCYTKSPAFKAMTAQNLAAIKARGIHAGRPQGRHVPCLECGRDVWEKPSTVRRFCSSLCYRAYMAKRFDRWLAQPQELALPQGFDEFMLSEELPCLVAGCGWRGRHLGTHVQLAHGITANQFKRAAGFNLTTGLVTPDLHARLRETNAGKGAPIGTDRFEKLIASRNDEAVVRYRSLEAREHDQKSRAMCGEGPTRECAGCGQPFVQSTVFGRAKYCTVKCRDWWQALGRSLRAKQRVRLPDGTFKWLREEGASNP